MPCTQMEPQTSAVPSCACTIKQIWYSFPYFWLLGIVVATDITYPFPNTFLKHLSL